jgi:hypothetical protein
MVGIILYGRYGMVGIVLYDRYCMVGVVLYGVYDIVLYGMVGIVLYDMYFIVCYCMGDIEYGQTGLAIDCAVNTNLIILLGRFCIRDRLNRCIRIY